MPRMCRGTHKSLEDSGRGHERLRWVRKVRRRDGGASAAQPLPRHVTWPAVSGRNHDGGCIPVNITWIGVRDSRIGAEKVVKGGAGTKCAELQVPCLVWPTGLYYVFTLEDYPVVGIVV